ncbi:MAG: hypothetical protein FWC41_03465 [Firmicutes bacterium]|nr:hypothetical protein [Bacillota bacterium]
MSKKFFCQYCGYQSSTISGMTGQRCSKSPNGKHIPYEGSRIIRAVDCKGANQCLPTNLFIDIGYTCKYCGRKAKTISSLTGNRCSKNLNEGADGTKYCVPL